MDGVLAIFGPTASGKTALAIAVAEHLAAAGREAVAISCDALQVYRGIEVLSGAPTAAERRRLEHRLVSFVALSDRYSAGRYAADAHREIDAALAAGRTPIVVGGTGLYLRAALSQLDLHPPVDAARRRRLERHWERLGAAAMHARLAAVAPASAARVAAGDRQRVLRALALAEQGVDEPLRDSGGLWDAPPRHPTRLIGLEVPAERLRARIDRRIEAMVAAGAAAEARAAAVAGASDGVRQALGFAELLAGDIDAMRARTHRYAKRQRTWLRRLPGVETIAAGDRPATAIAEEILAGR